MLVAFASLLLFAAALYALVRSLRARFVLGIFAGVARLAILVIVVVEVLHASATSFLPGLANAPATAEGGAGLVVALAAIAGPLVSFAIVFVAHRRTRDVPAAQEDAASAPFRAWLPVAILDAIGVVIQVGASIVASSS